MSCKQSITDETKYTSLIRFSVLCGFVWGWGIFLYIPGALAFWLRMEWNPKWMLGVVFYSSFPVAILTTWILMKIGSWLRRDIFIGIILSLFMVLLPCGLIFIMGIPPIQVIVIYVLYVLLFFGVFQIHKL